MGWAQNTSELAYERGGPDRWLSTYLVVENWLREHADSAAGERGSLLLGDVVARWWALRQLSLSVARKIDRGEAPARRVGPRQGDGHPLRAGRARAGAPTRRPRTVDGVGVAVRTAAGGGDPDRSVVHDPRRDDRDPALGGGEGLGVVTDQLLIDTANRLFADDVHPRGGAGRRARRLGAGRCGSPSPTPASRGSRSPRSAGGSGGTLTDAAAIVRDRRRLRRADPAGRDRTARRLARRRRPGFRCPTARSPSRPATPGDTLALSGGTVSGRAVARRVGPHGRACRRVAGRRRRLGGRVDRGRRGDRRARHEPRRRATRHARLRPGRRRHRAGAGRDRPGCAAPAGRARRGR